MAFCGTCGTQVQDGIQFCPQCGGAVAGYAPQAEFVPEAPGVNEAQDAEQNKLMGVLSYFGILWLIPFFTKKDSPFAMYHVKQGVNLTLLWVAYAIASPILRLIKVTKTESLWGIPYEVKVTPWFITLLLTLVSIGIGVLAILGIINAVKGKKEPLPLVGGITIADKFIK